MKYFNVILFVKWTSEKTSVTFTNKKRMSEKYKSYYEPFMGGGTVTFELLSAKVLISDINKALISAYK
mgnify:CR=1 FL=1